MKGSPVLDAMVEACSVLPLRSLAEEIEECITDITQENFQEQKERLLKKIFTLRFCIDVMEDCKKAGRDDLISKLLQEDTKSST